MKIVRILALIISIAVSTGCSPGIRFRPGEIPVPTATSPEYLDAGHQVYRDILSSQPVLQDHSAERRVSRILEKILKVTPSMGHWTVTLIDSPKFNAMTTPGNFIYVYRGMLEQARSDDEVAAVLAHEIGHRLGQHELKSSEQQLGEALTMLASIAAGVAMASAQGSTPRDVSQVMDATSALGAGFTTLRYEKDQEREADQIGMFLLADAGINPMAAADVWAGRIAVEGTGGNDFFSTHPLHEDRYAQAVSLYPIAQARYEASRTKKPRTSGAKPQQQQLSPALTFQISQAQDALAKNDLHSASTIARSLTAQAPRSPEVYNLLGHVQALQGDTAKAQKAFQKGLSLAPDSAILLYNMGCLHARQGDRAKALSSLRKAFTRDPQLVTNAPEDPDLASFVDDPEFTALLDYPYTAPAPAPQNVGGNTFSVN